MRREIQLYGGRIRHDSPKNFRWARRIAIRFTKISQKVLCTFCLLRTLSKKQAGPFFIIAQCFNKFGRVSQKIISQSLLNYSWDAMNVGNQLRLY